MFSGERGKYVLCVCTCVFFLFVCLFVYLFVFITSERLTIMGAKEGLEKARAY